MIKEYRKIATIKAERYQGTEEQCKKYGIHTIKTPPMVTNYNEYLPTKEGDMKINKGDWIATGIDGEHWAIANDIFRRTYEEVKDNGD